MSTRREDAEPGADKNQTEPWDFGGLIKRELTSFHFTQMLTQVCVHNHMCACTHTHTHTHSAMAIILKMKGEQFVYLELAWMRSLLVSGTAMLCHSQASLTAGWPSGASPGAGACVGDAGSPALMV